MRLLSGRGEKKLKETKCGRVQHRRKKKRLLSHKG